jgi:hypothetical protein
VGATFGRGIYVLDDYSALREASKVANAGANALFSVRDAWWYVPNVPSQAKGMPTAGSTSFRTPNPPFGALLTYYIGELPKTALQIREEKEKGLNAQGADIPFPGWDALKSETLDTEPRVLLLISDARGSAVRWLRGETSKGVHRTNWDLRMAAPDPIDLSQPSFIPPWVEDPQGPLVAPGTYSAQLYLVENGQLKAQGSPQSFQVKPTPQVKADINYEQFAAFTQKTADLARKAGAAGGKLGEAANRLKHIEAALVQTPSLEPAFFEQLKTLNNQLSGLQESLYGDPIRSAKNEPTAPSAAGKIWSVISGHWGTTQLPTATQERSIDLAGQELGKVIRDLEAFENDLAVFEAVLVKAGAPYTPGRKID